MTLFVLDTSAILTVLAQEEGLETVLSLFDQAREGQAIVYIPFMALMELEYLLLRKVSAKETQQVLALIQSWPAAIVESDADWRHLAATVKASTPLSVADAWNAALALREGAYLVHKDPEYEEVKGLQGLKLPYKTAGVP